MQARILSGSQTIGGNVVSFETQTTRLVMDFGVATTLSDQTLADLLDDGTLPRVNGFYDDGTVSGFEHEAILISHLHIDHMGGLSYLKAAHPPIYLHDDALKLYQTLIAAGDEKPVANLNAFPGSHFVIGDLTVDVYLSDHDTVGAVAIAVSDGQKRIVYSGDVRGSGLHPQRVLEWTRSLGKVDVLLLECTMFSFDDDEFVAEAVPLGIENAEMTLQTTFGEYLQTNETLVVVNPYVRNVERAMLLQQTAQAFGRQMIWDELFATVLRQFYPEETFLTLGEDVDLTTIQQHPAQFVLQNQYRNVQVLSLLRGSLYLHMSGDPVGAYDPRYAELQVFLAGNDIEFASLTAGGHADKGELVTVAANVQADLTLAWHSFKPERLAKALTDYGLQARSAKDGEII